jgi:hypothetical protein
MTRVPLDGSWNFCEQISYPAERIGGNKNDSESSWCNRSGDSSLRCHLAKEIEAKILYCADEIMNKITFLFQNTHQRRACFYSNMIFLHDE